jgi:hypothetical protein
MNIAIVLTGIFVIGVPVMFGLIMLVRILSGTMNALDKSLSKSLGVKNGESVCANCKSNLPWNRQLGRFDRRCRICNTSQPSAMPGYISQSNRVAFARRDARLAMKAEAERNFAESAAQEAREIAEPKAAHKLARAERRGRQ